jgi:hypothetical protein
MSVQGNPFTIHDSSLVLSLDAANIKSYVGSGTTWNDTTGNNATITLTNGPTYTSSFGGGITLDGTDDYINLVVPTGFSGTGNFTFEVLFRFNAGDSVGNGAHIIGTNGRSDGLLASANGTNTHLTIDGSGNLKIFTFNGGGSSTDYDTGFDVSVGEVCQVGFLHNSGVSKAGFKNGQLSTFESRWSTQAFSYLVIGGSHNEPGYFTQMTYPKITVFSVKVYNKVLSSPEILQNYNAVKSRFGL